MKLNALVRRLQKLAMAGHGDKEVIVTDLNCDSTVNAEQIDAGNDSRGEPCVRIIIDYGDHAS